MINNTQIYRKAIETFGKKERLLIIAEECIELAAELLKQAKGRNRTGDLENVLKEIADVKAVLPELDIIYHNYRDEIGKQVNKNLTNIEKITIERINNAG
jgi:NTP pyrophosphatase (non-canonical NTP hydrolase)